MTRKWTPLLFAILGLAAALAGALTAPTARATTYWGLWVNPGAATNALSCGWHSTCEDPWPSGNALDWGNSGSASVIWRSWATSSSSMGTTVRSEKDEDCPWDGAHLHQYSTASGWYYNTGVYPSAPSTGTGYDLSSQSNWQNRTSWAW